MAEDADIERVAIDLTLGIQADILIDLASGFARINHVAAAETIRTIEEKIVRDLRERATGLRARGLSAEGIAQVAGYVTDTIKEAREKMAEGETTLRSPSGGIFSRIFEFLVELLLGLHERDGVARTVTCQNGSANVAFSIITRDGSTTVQMIERRR